MDTLKTADELGADSLRVAPLLISVVYSPDASLVGRQLDFSTPQITAIGREVSSGVRIRDARLSTKHLEIASAGGELWFSDLGSSNGTFLNGVAASEGPLVPSDVLRVGDTLLVVSRGNPLGDLRAQAAVAASANVPVLLLGETGTGKEVLARAIHEASQRTGAFVPLNCATLPRELAGAELFGHARGAFSGAVTARPGLFRAAEGGTLFLDEIGDLPLDLQPALLRALEERKVRPIGAELEIAVDTRVIAATHVDLERAVEERRFRADLLGRLAHVVLQIPPLRARRAELLALAQGFCQGLSFAPDAAEALLLATFARNIRELKAIVESAALLARNKSLVRLSDVEARVPESAALVRARRVASGAPINPTPIVGVRANEVAARIPSAPKLPALAERKGQLESELATAERELILLALAETKTQEDAAKKLGISRRTLINRLDAHRIPRPRKNGEPERE